MMGRKKEQGGFALYRESAIMLAMLDDRTAGKVMRCAARYFLDGIEPTSIPDKAVYIWERIKSDIDKSRAKYEKVCERNALIAERRAASSQPDAARGNSVGNQSLPDGNQSLPNKNQNQNQNQNNISCGGGGDSACARAVDSPKNETPEADSADGNNLDPELEKAVDYYAQHIDSTFSRRTGEELTKWTTKLGADLMIYAIDSATAAGKRNWSYIRGILKSWDRQGIKTLADAQRRDAEHDAEVQRKASPGGASQRTAAQSNRRVGFRDITRSDAEREAADDWMKRAVQHAIKR